MNQVEFNDFVLRKLEEAGNVNLYALQQLCDMRTQVADLQQALLVSTRAAERDETSLRAIISAMMDVCGPPENQVRDRIAERLRARILHEGDDSNVCDSIGHALRLLEQL